MSPASKQKLASYAMSILWRASVHDWNLVGLNPAINLGPYQEALRLFLLGGEFLRFTKNRQAEPSRFVIG
jgi:hypothetical protein